MSASEAGFRWRVVGLDESWLLGSRGAAKPADDVVNPSVPEARVIEVQPVLLSVEQAARYVGVGRSEVFKMLREGRLKKSVRIGRRRLIPRSALDEFVEGVVREQED